MNLDVLLKLFFERTQQVQILRLTKQTDDKSVRIMHPKRGFRWANQKLEDGGVCDSYKEVVQILFIIRREELVVAVLRLVRAEEMLCLRQLSVDEGEMIDRGRYAKAPHMGGEELIAERVARDLGF